MQGNVNIPDSTITTNLSFRQLVLMNMQQLTNFPYIEKDFDALTDYELLCLVVKFLNDVIANQNEQNDSITRMYESFLALQDYVNNTKDTLEDAFNELDDYVRNYFANLDVQDEINNKLDEMADSGQLTDIIAQYLGLAGMIAFDTVADMKLAQNLVNGSKCRTLGFHSVNDGGGAYYKIRTKTNDDVIDEMTIIEVYNNLLIAELIYDKDINILCLGAKGDGVTNDSTQFNKLLLLTDNVVLPSKHFVINSIPLKDNLKINGNNAHLTIVNNVCFDLSSNVWNCEIADLLISGNETSSSLLFDGDSNFRNGRLTNIRVNKFYSMFDQTNMLATMINKCNFVALNSIGRLRFYDGTINQCYFDTSSVPYVENGTPTLILTGSLSTMSNCFFNGNTTSGVPTFLQMNNSYGFNIENCNFDYNDGNAIICNGNSGLNIKNCTFRGNAREVDAYITEITGEVKIVNCSFLLPHDNSYPYNQNALILKSNGYTKKAILENNYYQVNFNYDSSANQNADRVLIKENEVYMKNVIPFGNISSFEGVNAALQFVKTIGDGFYASGTSTATSNIFINGTSTNTTTLFTIKAGTYKAFTNSSDVELVIKTSAGSTRYKNNENITFDNDVDVIAIALRLPTSTYNKTLYASLYLQ